MSDRASGELFLPPRPMLEMEDGAVIFDLDRMPDRVELGGPDTMHVRACHEEIQLANWRRVLLWPRRVLAHLLERDLEPRLVEPFAVEDRARVAGLRTPQQFSNVPVLSPEVGDVPEITPVAQSVREHDAVDAAGGRAADHVHDDVGVDQRLEQPVRATSVHGTEELLRDAMDVDGERDAAVEHETGAYLARLGHRCRVRPSHGKASVIPNAVAQEIVRRACSHDDRTPRCCECERNSCSRSAAGDCGLLHSLASTLGWARRGCFCDLRASRCERLPETYSARRLRQQASWIAGTAGAIPVSGPDQLTRDVLIIHTPHVPRPTCLSVTGRPDALRASLI